MLKISIVLKNNLKQKIFFFACDYSENTGEGRLGRKFINQFENIITVKQSI